MVLQLHRADNRGVVQNGGDMICPLQDADQATVRMEVNGEYSLTVNLPSGAKNSNLATFGRAIKAMVDEDGTEQFFIIKSRRRSLTDGVEVYAEHQSYYYNGVIIGAGAASQNGQPRVVFQGLREYAVPDIKPISTWTYSRSTALRARFPERPIPIPVMQGLKEHLIGAAGGELRFDGFDVEYVDQLGRDRGASYRYAVNLTSLESEDILDGYASAIYPFWGSQGDPDRPITTLSQKILEYDEPLPLQVVVPVDFSELFETQPTQAQLLAAAQEYADKHTPTGVPESLRAERAAIAGNVPVALGDTVTVTSLPWRLETKTRIMAMEFDALRERAISVELGTVNPGFYQAVKKAARQGGLLHGYF